MLDGSNCLLAVIGQPAGVDDLNGVNETEDVDGTGSIEDTGVDTLDMEDS